MSNPLDYYSFYIPGGPYKGDYSYPADKEKQAKCMARRGELTEIQLHIHKPNQPAEVENIPV